MIRNVLKQRFSIKTIEPFNDYVGVRCGHNERIEIDLTNKTVTKFDKTAYQRNYMRKLRAQKKANG